MIAFPHLLLELRFFAVGTGFAPSEYWERMMPAAVPD
jgi:hypothetical protein